jgi:hypothetical protein
VFVAGALPFEALLEPFVPKLIVLAPGEIPAVVSVRSLGVLR